MSQKRSIWSTRGAAYCLFFQGIFWVLYARVDCVLGVRVSIPGAVPLIVTSLFLGSVCLASSLWVALRIRQEVHPQRVWTWALVGELLLIGGIFFDLAARMFRAAASVPALRVFTALAIAGFVFFLAALWGVIVLSARGVRSLSRRRRQ